MPAKIGDPLFDALQEAIRELARPIDFDELAAKGILSKSGAWYRVHKPKSLPKHVRQRITDLAQDAKGLKVKFGTASRYQRLARKLSEVDLR
jgi:hypothetical protein